MLNRLNKLRRFIRLIPWFEQRCCNALYRKDYFTVILSNQDRYRAVFEES